MQRLKKFGERAARNLDNITAYSTMILFINFFICIGATAQGQTEDRLASLNDYFLSVSVIVLVVFVAYAFIVGRVISEIDKYSSTAKYQVLRMRPIYGKIGGVIAFVAFAIAISWNLVMEFGCQNLSYRA